MSRAMPGAIWRFDGAKMNPTASAPMATASKASSSRVMPQIFTNTPKGYGDASPEPGICSARPRPTQVPDLRPSSLGVNPLTATEPPPTSRARHHDWCQPTPAVGSRLCDSERAPPPSPQHNRYPGVISIARLTMNDAAMMMRRGTPMIKETRNAYRPQCATSDRTGSIRRPQARA